MLTKARRSSFAGGRPVVCIPPNVAALSRVRTTLLSASLLAIKEQGLLEAYMRELSPAHREYIESIVGMDWAPTEIGMAHYGALDRLGLSAKKQYEMGLEVGSRINRSLLGTAMRLAGEAGATPWTVLAQLPRLWSRMLEGGAVGVYELGPKDARVELVGCPLARFAYCRNGWRGMLVGAMTPLCRKIFTNDVPEMIDDTRYTMHLAWV
jgi:hypothetical protein